MTRGRFDHLALHAREQWVPPFEGSGTCFPLPITAFVTHMESAAKRRLGDIFVERGLITEEQLQEALTVQQETGRRLGEVLGELGLVTRVALAGVITEQWDELRVTERGRKTAQASPRASSSVAEVALRERLEALTAELAARDQRSAQQDATIAARGARLG